jgi:hypothetical protein
VEVGEKGERRAYVDGQEISPVKGGVFEKGGIGFEWGFGGSPVSHLALAICLYVYDDMESALTSYLLLKEIHLSRWSFGKPHEYQIDFDEFLHNSE